MAVREEREQRTAIEFPVVCARGITVFLLIVFAYR